MIAVTTNMTRKARSYSMTREKRAPAGIVIKKNRKSMERNKKAFEFMRVNLGDVARAAADGVDERFAPPQSRLEVTVDEALPEVWADRDAMETVFLNLLDNAWKYSGDEKLIRVRVYADRDNVLAEVSDNGVGMSRQTTRRIFDKFYQVDQRLSREVGGCGLGMSIVKFILDAHGGTIDVRSQLGKGSTFTIRLPIANGQQTERGTN